MIGHGIDCWHPDLSPVVIAHALEEMVHCYHHLLHGHPVTIGGNLNPVILNAAMLVISRLRPHLTVDLGIVDAIELHQKLLRMLLNCTDIHPAYRCVIRSNYRKQLELFGLLAPDSIGVTSINETKLLPSWMN